LKPSLNAKPENLRLNTFGIPATPRTAHKARSTTREALELVTGNSATSCKLRALISQLNKGLQQSITEKEIGDIIHKKFRDQVTQRSNATTNDRRRLTKARVITTEEVIRLREEREAADAKKAAKAGKGKGKEKKIKSGESTTPKPRGRPKKVVNISDEVVVHSISPEKEVGVVPDEEGWYYIEDLSGSDDEFITPPRRRGVNKAWERDQIEDQLGENVDSEPRDHGRVLRVRK
jgi:hypothetical protein